MHVDHLRDLVKTQIFDSVAPGVLPGVLLRDANASGPGATV